MCKQNFNEQNNELGGLGLLIKNNSSSNATNVLQKSSRIGLSVALVVAMSIPVSTQTTFSDDNFAYATPVSDKQAEADAALSQLSSLQDQLGVAENDYNQAVMEQEAAKSKMDEAQNKIDETQQKIEDLQGQLGTRARSMYRSGASTLLDLILGCTTFEAFAQNWDILNSLNNKDSNMVSESKSLKAELNEQKALYVEQEKVASTKASEANAKMAEAQSLVSTQQAVYNQLSDEVSALVAQQQAAQEAANQQAAVTQIQQANNSSTNTQNNTSSSSSYNNQKPQSVSGNAVVSRAYAELGKPYSWGGVGPSGYDCSGFVSYCLTGSHSRLGTTYTFMNWTRVSDPQPGDVCVNSGHAGIYIGGGQMIHAATYGVGVVIGGVQGGMIYVRY